MTKVLEYHFNPPFRRNSQTPIWLKKKNQNYFFDGLCFYPANSKEKLLGHLCIIAELCETKPEETEVLSGLVKIVQREYYRFFYPNPTDCFKWALEQGNRFLARQLKNNNTNWLGKLNFAVFAIRPDLSVNLAKIGSPAALLFTNGEVFDLSHSLTQEAGPFKSFSNTIEGSVQNTDKILLLSQKLFETFDEEEIFRWILSAKTPRIAKNVFKQKKEVLRQSFGVCLLVFAKSKKFHLPAWPLMKRYVPISKTIQPHLGQKRPIDLLQTILLFLILAALIFLGWRLL